MTPADAPKFAAAGSGTGGRWAVVTDPVIGADGDLVYDQTTGLPLTRNTDNAHVKNPHTAPGRHSGTPATMIDDALPDVLAHPDWYGTGNTTADAETVAVLRRIHQDPHTLVTVYRAAPTGRPVNPGDWVTLSKTYARDHAIQLDNPADDWPVHAITVRASDLYTAGDLNEYGWDPADDINRRDLAGLGRPWPTDQPLSSGSRLPKPTITHPTGRRIHLIESGGAVPGGYNGTFLATDADSGTALGHLDYQSVPGQPARIAMVEVTPDARGLHLADLLTARLAAEFPDDGITGEMLTDDGGGTWWPNVAARMGWT